ncbi:hypothetical protein QZH41_001960 [Actinostola sp. cb2023]|nr:hypothetical protein QZH41_001960 [Actinostola sp. cb2023]
MQLRRNSFEKDVNGRVFLVIIKFPRERNLVLRRILMTLAVALMCAFRCFRTKINFMTLMKIPVMLPTLCESSDGYISSSCIDESDQESVESFRQRGEFYNGDKRTPVYQWTPKILTSEKAVIILLCPIDQEVLATAPPRHVEHNCIFVVDLSQLANKEDVKCDDLGTWRNNGLKTRCYVVDEEGTPKTVDDDDVLPGETTYTLKRQYYKNKSSPDLKKYMFSLKDDSDNDNGGVSDRSDGEDLPQVIGVGTADIPCTHRQAMLFQISLERERIHGITPYPRSLEEFLILISTSSGFKYNQGQWLLVLVLLSALATFLEWFEIIVSKVFLYDLHGSQVGSIATKPLQLTDNGPHYHNTGFLMYLAEVNKAFEMNLVEYNNFESGEGKAALDTHFARISHRVVRWFRIGNDLESGGQLSEMISQEVESREFKKQLKKKEEEIESMKMLGRQAIFILTFHHSTTRRLRVVHLHTEFEDSAADVSSSSTTPMSDVACDIVFLGDYRSEEFEDRLKWKHCALCKVKMPSGVSSHTHISGKRHRCQLRRIPRKQRLPNDYIHRGSVISTETVMSCDSCEMKEIFSTGLGKHSLSDLVPRTLQGKDINRRAVFASNEVGMGREGLATICEILGMPPPVAPNAWAANDAELCKQHLVAVKEELDMNQQEVMQHCNDNGLTSATVSFDGTWAKQGFTSNHGVGFVISAETGNVLDYAVESKACNAYNIQQKKLSQEDFQEWQESHECPGGFEGSSPSMETACAKRVWENSTEIGLQYRYMVSDGVSKAYDEDMCKKEWEKPYVLFYNSKKESFPMVNQLVESLAD